MKHETLHFECVCGLATGPVENDIAEEDGADTQLPEGWVRIYCRRVMQNPDFAAPQTAEEIIEERLATVAPPSPEEAEQLRAMMAFDARREAREQDSMAEPRHFVDEVELHLCPDHAAMLYPLDGEAFEDAGWKPTVAPEPVADPAVFAPAAPPAQQDLPLAEAPTDEEAPHADPA